eukprot:1149224-Pelagomonas_calceolata.AAC.5
MMRAGGRRRRIGFGMVRGDQDSIRTAGGDPISHRKSMRKENNNVRIEAITLRYSNIIKDSGTLNDFSTFGTIRSEAIISVHQHPYYLQHLQELQ